MPPVGFQSRYPFLKKEQEREAKIRQDLLKKSDAMIASGVPLSLQYGLKSANDMIPSGGAMGKSQFMTNTGDGGNGQVEPSNPVEMVRTTQGPRMIHEGEGKIQNSNGSTTVVPQSQLAQMEQGMKIPGYQEGGTYYESGGSASAMAPLSVIPQNQQVDLAGRPTTTTPAPMVTPTVPGATKTPYQTAFQTGLRGIQDVAMGRDTFGQQQQAGLYGQYRGTEAAAKAGMQQTAAQLGMDTGAALTEQAMKSRDLAASYGTQATALRDQLGQRQQAAASQLPNVALAGMQEARTAETEAQRQVKDEFMTAAEMGDDATVAAAYEKYFKRPMDPNASVQDIRNYARSLRGEGVAQAKLTTEAQFIDNEAKRWNLTNDKMTSAIQAINNGVPLADVNATYGTNMAQSDYDSIARQYKQTVRAGDIANDAAQLNVDSGKMESIIRDINNGVPLDRINSTYGTNMDATQYASIAKKYELTVDSLKTQLSGEKFNQLQNMVNTGATFNDFAKQLATDLGIPAERAAGVYASMQTMYNLKKDSALMTNQSQRFGVNAQAYSNLVDMVSTGATFDQVWPRMKEAGMTDMEQAREAYRSMAVQYNLGVQATELQIDAAKLGLSDAQYKSAYDMVKMGTDDQTVIQTLVANGMSALNAQATVSGMKRMAYGKEDMITMANNLIQLGGPDNYAKAANLMQNVYGVKPDFSKLTTAEQQADYQTAMSTMSQVVGTTTDWTVAKASLKASGDYDTLLKSGYDDAGIEKLFGAMRLAQDPLYQSTFAIQDETLDVLYPGQDHSVVRQSLAKLMTTGFMTIDEDGNITFDKDKIGELADIFSPTTGGTATAGGTTTGGASATPIVTTPNAEGTAVTVSGVTPTGGTAPQLGALTPNNPSQMNVDQQAAAWSTLSPQLKSAGVADADQNTAYTLGTALGHYPSVQEYRDYAPASLFLTSGGDMTTKVEGLADSATRTAVNKMITSGAIPITGPTIVSTKAGIDSSRVEVVNKANDYMKQNVGKFIQINGVNYLLSGVAGVSAYGSDPNMQINVVDATTGTPHRISIRGVGKEGVGMVAEYTLRS